MAAKKPVAGTPDDAYLRDLKKKFSLAQDICEPARREWQIDQDYYDGKQWTPEEIAILNRRKQPALVFNHVKPAINGMIGLVERGKTDPKALGRAPDDADSAEVMTDALRYAADINRFQSIRSQALKDLFIPGICCAVVEVDEKRDPKVTKGRPEAFFYDPYSREPDFSDARFLGLANWMDEDDANSLPYVDGDKKKLDAIKSSIDAGTGFGNASLSANATNADRPSDGWSWADNVKRRVMVVQMWHKRGPIWHMCVFVANGILEQGESPYKDQDGRPACQLIAQSAYVDRDNKRYGAVRDMRGPSDAINKGRSKAVHLLNVAKLRVNPGTQDIDAVRAEYAKPDGIIEARDGEIEELGDKQLMPSHIELLRDAKAEMQRQSPTPGIVGRNASSQSGKAILAEQQAGMTEQSPLLASFDDWTLRIYRAMFGCIKQFWDAPRYIRVTGDASAPKYVLLNQAEPVTDAKGQPVIDPQTGQTKIRFVKPAEMDVDIIIDSQPDVASLQQDQYQGLLELAQVAMQTQSPDQIPLKAIVKASSLPHKRELLDEMEQAAEQRQKSPQQPDPAMIEQAKQKTILEANQAKLQQETHAKQVQGEMDAQAHAATLAREDQADQAKAQRQAALAEQTHAHAQQSLQADAAFEAHKSNLKLREMSHGAKLARKAAQVKAQKSGVESDAASEQQAEDEPSSDAPMMDDFVEPEVQALTALAQAMERLATAQERTAHATEQGLIIAARQVQIAMAPKVLQRTADGQKYAVPILETMN